jgi:ubiquitin carboxyl-terminal hydrolase 47
MKIKKFPKNLILCLNRFEYDLTKGIKKKINTEFDFPEKIEEINGIKSNYFLYGIIVHSGSAMNGHYYSIIKNYEDDNKWYKFDDINVYEIENFNELYDKIKGNENNQNDNTAYLLFYIENSEIENIKNLTFKVNENLLNDINEEEEIYRKQIEEEKERLSYINLKINHDNKVDFIRIKKTETLKNFKMKIYDLYQIDKTLEGRIIIYDNRKSKILNVFEKEKDEEILENLNFTSNLIYDLETKKENEEFEKFDPNDLFVDIILWNENYLKQNKNEIEKNFQKIKINKNMNFEEL